MANIAVNDVIEVRTVCVLGTQTGENVVHYKATADNGVGTPLTTAEAAYIFANAFSGAYIPVLPTVGSFYGCGCRIVSGTPTVEDGSSTFAAAGGDANDPLPAQLTGIIAKSTGFGGRAYRGRIFVPFPTTAALDAAGNPNGTYKSNAAVIGTTYTGTVSLTNVSGRVLSIGPCLRHKNGTTTAIISTVVRAAWGTMRSRGGYGRPNLPPVWP